MLVHVVAQRAQGFGNPFQPLTDIVISFRVYLPVFALRLFRDHGRDVADRVAIETSAVARGCLFGLVSAEHEVEDAALQLEGDLAKDAVVPRVRLARFRLLHVVCRVGVRGGGPAPGKEAAGWLGARRAAGCFKTKYILRKHRTLITKIDKMYI